MAVDATGNPFIADQYNDRIREVHLPGLPTLTLGGVEAANGGFYQVIITSPDGRVTSAVSTLTVLLPPGIVMKTPVMSGNNLLIAFSISNSLSSSFTLLQTPNLTGPWTTKTGAVLTTNAQSGGYQFSIPTTNSLEFYRVRLP